MQLLVNNWAFREYPFNDTVTSYQLISLPVEFSKLWFYATLSIPQLSKSFHAPVPTFQKCIFTEQQLSFLNLDINMLSLLYSIKYRLKTDLQIIAFHYLPLRQQHNPDSRL